jgi:hypothetical protein
MIAVWLPSGMYIAMGLGIFALGAGVVAYRNRARPGPSRLVAAGAITIASLAVILAAGRYALTLLAITKLETMMS